MIIRFQAFQRVNNPNLLSFGFVMQFKDLKTFFLFKIKQNLFYWYQASKSKSESKRQRMKMRFIAIMLAFLLLGSLSIKCSDIHVKDDQSWYEDDLNTGKLPNQNDNFKKDNNDPIYQKLLSVERQMLMSEQIIKLYQERLSVLKELRKELKIILSRQKIQSQAQQKHSKSSEANPQVSNQKKKVQQNQHSQHKNQPSQYRRNSQSGAYVFLKQYQVDVSGSQDESLVDDSIVLLHPFVINKAKSEVFILTSQKNSDKIPKFQYGQTSNRLLFYWPEKSHQENKHHVDEQESQKGTHFTLNLALQIKPNKIKSVKINYYQRAFSNQSAVSNDFNVEQVVTSYESNKLISSDFKWHNALEFENQIIGFVNQKVYIKGKDKKMNEVEIGSQVLGVYSLNQYKLLYIAEDKVGTINVRSFTKSDEFRFQYYLGNKTLIKQKELQKKSQQNAQVQDDYSHESFDPGSYWHSPFTKIFSNLRAVSVHHLQATKQVLILLSNGQLLMYSNQKFTASTNLGPQLIKTLGFDHLVTNNDPKILSNIKIKMDLLPSFKQILISSNFYSKILIFNVTIPHLTPISKSSGMQFFSSSARSNELTAKYWQNLQISGQKSQLTQRNGIKTQDTQIYVFTASPSQKHRVSQVTKRSSDLDEKVVYLYYCQHSHSKMDQQLIGQKSNQDQPTLELTSIKHITISEYRLLWNLFDENSLISTTSQTSQGRSFWWNILLAAMIVIGVLIIRKCKQSSPKPNQWEDPASQKFLYKSKNAHHSATNTSMGKAIPKMTKQQDKLEKKPTTTKTKIEYDNMVISQLQSYLEKQGQKLSKQEIAFMIRQMQQNQQNQAMKKTQMKRQQKTEETPQNINLHQKNNPKNVDEKQKKKQNEQEKKIPQKVEHNSKRKKQ